MTNKRWMFTTRQEIIAKRKAPRAHRQVKEQQFVAYQILAKHS